MKRPKVDPLMFRRKQVRAARALLGWTQHRLGEKTGLSHPTIVNYELGKHRSYKADLIYKALEAEGIIFTARGIELKVKRTRPSLTKSRG
jgi:transcriptional regulator with XRE-family HTH domain